MIFNVILSCLKQSMKKNAQKKSAIMTDEWRENLTYCFLRYSKIS
ncbi:hypothetical protein BSI_27980 [Bacillus inaquosorum KCTC 13429]|uniref:Uncharacterized protein n=1 Tax=Bacillus inaquosorum KCTC 13429 TaxID=1236548 RepID=A0A9W5LGN6_9BACI|nr:hypothetical protein BSI_27980 [Bacillus inaquosorum KCTC 13429]